MADGSLIGALWQTWLTRKREWRTRYCSWCEMQGRKVWLRHVVSERWGYVRRCPHCGAEYNSDGRPLVEG